MFLAQKNNRGQAMVELAVYGGLILFVLAAFLSYVQHVNDKQYLKMDTFRRALQRANTSQSQESESPGASVQMVHVQDRVHADVLKEFARGTTQEFDNDANVFWAVPTAGAYANGTGPTSGAGEGTGNPKDLILGRINDDEQETEEYPREFYVDSESKLDYYDESTGNESGASISSEHRTARKETLTTTMPGMTQEQYSYRDPQKQYRYYSEVPGDNRTVKRAKQWQTNQ